VEKVASLPVNFDLRDGAVETVSKARRRKEARLSQRESPGLLPPAPEGPSPPAPGGGPPAAPGVMRSLSRSLLSMPLFRPRSRAEVHPEGSVPLRAPPAPEAPAPSPRPAPSDDDDSILSGQSGDEGRVAPAPAPRPPPSSVAISSERASQ